MILTPLVDDDSLSLVDWLELSAFFSAAASMNLDEVQNALEISQDEELEDIAEDDLEGEDSSSQLADEIKRRLEVLGTAYPFEITENGERLRFVGIGSFGRLSYLISLIISNSWRDGKLTAPLKLTDAELRQARDIFEIVATIAALGRTGGPAFLLGSNRANAEGLLARIAHICAVTGEGVARAMVPDAAPEAANDDGIDIIAVDREPDGPPARSFLFGQSASGRNFEGKPISNLVKGFLDIWYDTQPGNHEAAMFIPAILPASKLRYWNGRLGQMIHRPRLAYYADRGISMLEDDQNLLHFVDNVDAPRAWFQAYEDRVRGGVAA